MLKSLKGLSAIVAGGGSETGLATVEKLVKNGCHVSIFDINCDTLRLPKNSTFIHTDISNNENVKDSFTEFNRKSKLDILINVASSAKCKKLHSYKEPDLSETMTDKFNEMVGVNIYGTFYLMTNACKLFADNEPDADGERGVIINKVGLDFIDGQSSQSYLSATSAAIVGMIQPVVKDLKSMGVRVNVIATSFIKGSHKLNMSDRLMDQYLEFIPCPLRFAQPSEFAKLVDTILTNRMINGETIRLDGALRLPGNY